MPEFSNRICQSPKWREIKNQCSTGPFFFAAAKIRIGCGSTVAAGAGATPTAFYLGLCRLRGILSLPASHDHAAGGPFFSAQQRLESDADIVNNTNSACETLHRFSSLGLKSRIDAGKRMFPRKSMHRLASLGLKSRIDARKRMFPGKSLHRFPSSGLKSRIDAALALRRRSAGETIRCCRKEN